MKTNFLPLAIGGASLTSIIFAQWLCSEDNIDLGEGMKYHEDRHKCIIDLLRFCEFLGALPKGMKEEVWNDHVLDNHHETIEDNVVE